MSQENTNSSQNNNYQTTYPSGVSYGYPVQNQMYPFQYPYSPHSYINPLMYEIAEIKKNMDILYSDLNKIKSLQDLNNNNSVISNNFIDSSVEKFKHYDETNKEFLSQMKLVDSRLNSAFRKIERIKKSVTKFNDKNDNNDNDNKEQDNGQLPNKIRKRIVMMPPPMMSMFGGGGGFDFNKEKSKDDGNDLIDSEDEYDMSSEIYMKPDISKIEEDIIEIKLEIQSISDLIEIGLKYKKDTTEKDSEEKESDENSDDKDHIILKNKNNGIIIIDGKDKDKGKNNDDEIKNHNLNINESFFEQLITQALTQALVSSMNELQNKKEDEKNKTEFSEEKHYYEYDGKKYSVDINKLINLVEPLKKLENLIGMTKIKNNILEMILYYIQHFESNTSNMLHTSIEGPPAVGKTKLGRILAHIYHALGVIPSKRFKRVRRTDLIGKYLGHTAHKTQEVIDEAEGGVLFIDEAYSLGSSEGEKDIYSKECIDTINMNLTEKKKNLIVIIAGYTDQLDKSFFAVNEGLKRRFPFRFTIDGYDEKEMKDIFYAQVRRMKWFIDTELSAEFLEDFFKKHKAELPHFGGDIETILLNCKMTHAKRVLGKPYVYHKIINKEDLLNAFDRFKNNKKVKDDSIPNPMMYN